MGARFDKCREHHNADCSKVKQNLFCFHMITREEKVEEGQEYYATLRPLAALAADHFTAGRPGILGFLKCRRGRQSSSSICSGADEDHRLGDEV